MRVTFPLWIGRRHQGLGNELIPWAKAFITSQELEIKFLPPALGLNDRRYYEYFGTSRLDWIYYAILQKVREKTELEVFRRPGCYPYSSAA